MSPGPLVASSLVTHGVVGVGKLLVSPGPTIVLVTDVSKSKIVVLPDSPTVRPSTLPLKVGRAPTSTPSPKRIAGVGLLLLIWFHVRSVPRGPAVANPGIPCDDQKTPFPPL